MKKPESSTPPAKRYEGRRIDVTEEELRFSDGSSVILEMVRHPGAAAIVPVQPSGEVLLVRQYRHAAREWIYEVPAGTLDQGEEPVACARRELIEETGYRADHLLELGFIYTTPGFTDEKIHLFLATELEAVGQRLEADELIQVQPTPLAEAMRMIHEGRICDGKSIAALVRAERAYRALSS